MTIDKSGTWWKGTEFADIAEYLRDVTADGYPADGADFVRGYRAFVGADLGG